MATIRSNLKIGEMLVKEGIITSQQLETALEEHKKTGDFLGITIVNLGFTKESNVIPVLSKQLNIEYVDLSKQEISPEVIEKVPAKFASHYKLMPILIENNTLKVAVTDPLDLHTLDDINLILGYEVKPVLAGKNEILEAIKRYYGLGADTVEEIVGKTVDAKESIPDGIDIREEQDRIAEDASIMKFVNEILVQAVKDRATDIHIEPFENSLRVRYRVDGVLHEISVPGTIKQFQSSIVSRIKIISNLNIAERRLPQDGRARIKVAGREYDLRVSILPTPHGETVNLRILSSQMLLSLGQLGLSENNQKILEMLIRRPHGIIYVTGPTGSGKTTTLYACIKSINTPDKKILTIEDPVEYQLDGITQMQVHSKIGLAFASGLRSMLRHDPDIMLVGEVRDLETAEFAVRVALTGHLVFSTLHTNNAAGAITRLIDMGVEPFLISASLECSIAQRLVRVLCNKCKKKYKPDKAILKEFGVGKEKTTLNIHKAVGCDECKNTGYSGRTAIYEFLLIDDDIKDMILTRGSVTKINQKAIEKGMRTLRQDGWIKVKKGITTPEEVLRVSQ